MNISEVVIRTLGPEDATAWHALRTQPQVVWGTLQLPTLTVDDVRSQLAAGPDVHRLGAEVDGRLAGTVDLWVGSGMERHTGALGISVHDAYQGRGLGRRLMAAMLDVADNSLLLDRVDLEVYVDNERAINLYLQCGFEAEGISRHGAMRDGAAVPRERRPAQGPASTRRPPRGPACDHPAAPRARHRGRAGPPADLPR